MRYDIYLYIYVVRRQRGIDVSPFGKREENVCKVPFKSFIFL